MLNAAIRHLSSLSFVAISVWTEFRSSSMSDCLAIIIPPTAFIMAISGLRERTFLIFPTNLLPLTNVSRVADQMMLFRDVL